MVVESDLVHLSIPDQFFEFSKAYLESASILCGILKRARRKSSYARGSVVLYLTGHAIELFLKGAILLRKPSEKLTNSHDLCALNRRYRKLYPATKHKLVAPFISEDEADLSGALGPESAMKLRSHLEEWSKRNPWGQRHRYPRNRELGIWVGAVGFEPVSFHLELKDLKTSVARLIKVICQGEVKHGG